MPPETAHELFKHCAQLSRPFKKIIEDIFCPPEISHLSQDVFGLTFKHPIGLAAGFDKEAEMIDILSCFGFSFVEAGTVTLRPQSGNPTPRIFRLLNDKALINRMGFPSQGARAFRRNIERLNDHRIPIGVNIGKNKLTSNENAADEYAELITTLYNQADYFCVNVSSPNTPGLRTLLSPEYISGLMKRCFDARDKCKNEHKKYVPILLKLSPDIKKEEVLNIVDAIDIKLLDGWVLVNTTTSRPDSLKSGLKNQEGGLSGSPLLEKNLEFTRLLYDVTGKTHPIISVGGVFNADDVIGLIGAGATLVQIYTGWIYEGPGLLKELISGIDESMKQNGFTDITSFRQKKME